MNEFRVEQQSVTPANFLTSPVCVRAHLPSCVYGLVVAVCVFNAHLHMQQRRYIRTTHNLHMCPTGMGGEVEPPEARLCVCAQASVGNVRLQ